MKVKTMVKHFIDRVRVWGTTVDFLMDVLT